MGGRFDSGRGVWNLSSVQVSELTDVPPVAVEPSRDPDPDHGAPRGWPPEEAGERERSELDTLLLRLSEVARAAEIRARLHEGRGRGLRARLTRRAGLRARRAIVRQALAGRLQEAAEPQQPTLELAQAPPVALEALPVAEAGPLDGDTAELPVIVLASAEEEPDAVRLRALNPEPEPKRPSVVRLPSIEPDPEVLVSEPRVAVLTSALAAVPGQTALLERISAYTLGSTVRY